MAVGAGGRSLATLTNLEAQLAKGQDQITGTLTLGLGLLCNYGRVGISRMKETEDAIMSLTQYPAV